MPGRRTAERIATTRPAPYARVLLLVPLACAVMTTIVLLYLADPLDTTYVAVNGGPGPAGLRDLAGVAFWAYQLLAPLALAALVVVGAVRPGPSRRLMTLACGVYLVVSVGVLTALAARVGWALAMARFLPLALIGVLVPFAVGMLVLHRERPAMTG